MRFKKAVLLCVLFYWAFIPGAHATERLFTYTYEPETMPRGALEFEQWVTYRSTRNDAAGQDHYTCWDLREELEYGLTDNYTLSLYLNEKAEYFRDPATHDKTNKFEFEGVSLENKWMVLDPARNPVGLSLYLEPSIGNGEFELEEKIILGQRFGPDKGWKWAFNAVHATEWKDPEDTDKKTGLEGELEFDLGITRELGKHWNLGVEFRNHNEMPEYKAWEHTAFFAGPVVSYHRGNWWATFTFMTQAYGHNRTSPDPDENKNFVLDEHELFNARLIAGVSF